MINQELIVRKIIDSGLMVKTIEQGAGIGVANAILRVSGASKCFYSSHCYYSKESQSKLYGDSERSVSLKRVWSMLKKEIIEMSGECNSVYIASYQIGQDKINHGWIGFYHEGQAKFYHVTIPTEYSKLVDRDKIIDDLGTLGCQIILSKNNSNQISEFIFPIDICFDWNKNIDYEMIFKSKDSFYTVFESNGNISRLEDKYRNTKKLISYKGSFNPIHHAHLEISKLTKESSDGDFAFMISIDTFDKGKINISDIKERVHQINKLGYDCIICNSGYFADNVNDILSRTHLSKIIFPMGYDTYKRIVEFDKSDSVVFDSEKCSLFVYNRPGFTLNKEYLDRNNNVVFFDIEFDISSTQIRQLDEFKKYSTSGRITDSFNFNSGDKVVVKNEENNTENPGIIMYNNSKCFFFVRIQIDKDKFIDKPIYELKLTNIRK